MKSQKVILLLGGNEQNTARIINEAMLLIQKEIGAVSRVSGLYKTAAWGPIPQPDYLNIAITVHSKWPPLCLLQKILSIETRLGRKRTVKYGPRTIDIDMLFYGYEIMNHKNLVIPHPQIQNRRFVLLPCSEIIPGFIHPVSGLSITKLLELCKDTLTAVKWTN